MPSLNLYSDLTAIANNIQEDAYFAVREGGTMQRLIKVFQDSSGGNPRVGYYYSSNTAVAIDEDTDLNSTTFKPTQDQTLTPGEIGLQYFVSDLRAESELPENIIADAKTDLALAALAKVESDLCGDLSSLSGGTIGASGSAITWGYVSAAIAQARNANKNPNVPLSCVIHGYQWAVLAKAASVAGSSLAQAPGVTEEITRTGWVATFMGVPIYQVFASPDSSSDFIGGVFPATALAIDWRRGIKVEAERNASRRGTEFNMSAVYAHGGWRPALGVKMTFAATAPTS